MTTRKFTKMYFNCIHEHIFYLTRPTITINYHCSLVFIPEGKKTKQAPRICSKGLHSACKFTGWKLVARAQESHIIFTKLLLTTYTNRNKLCNNHEPEDEISEVTHSRTHHSRTRSLMVRSTKCSLQAPSRGDR